MTDNSCAHPDSDTRTHAHARGASSVDDDSRCSCDLFLPPQVTFSSAIDWESQHRAYDLDSYYEWISAEDSDLTFPTRFVAVSPDTAIALTHAYQGCMLSRVGRFTSRDLDHLFALRRAIEREVLALHGAVVGRARSATPCRASSNAAASGEAGNPDTADESGERCDSFAVFARMGNRSPKDGLALDREHRFAQLFADEVVRCQRCNSATSARVPPQLSHAPHAVVPTDGSSKSSLLNRQIGPGTCIIACYRARARLLRCAGSEMDASSNERDHDDGDDDGSDDHTVAIDEAEPTASVSEPSTAQRELRVRVRRIADEVMCLLLTSERVFCDLSASLDAMIERVQRAEPHDRHPYPHHQSESSANGSAFASSLALRVWDEQLDSVLEFRCFIHHHRLCAVSQYNHFVCVDLLLHARADLDGDHDTEAAAARRRRQRIALSISHFWRTRVVACASFHERYRSYVMDVAVYFDEAVDRSPLPSASSLNSLSSSSSSSSLSIGDQLFGLRLIELNPFLEITGGSLFAWEDPDDRHLMLTGEPCPHQNRSSYPAHAPASHGQHLQSEVVTERYDGLPVFRYRVRDMPHIDRMVDMFASSVEPYLIERGILTRDESDHSGRGEDPVAREASSFDDTRVWHWHVKQLLRQQEQQQQQQQDQDDVNHNRASAASPSLWLNWFGARVDTMRLNVIGLLRTSCSIM